MERIKKSWRTRGVGSWKGGKEFDRGKEGDGFSFSDHTPPQASLEVTMHDIAEGC